MPKKEQPYKLVTVDEKYDVIASTDYTYTNRNRVDTVQFCYFDETGFHLTDKAKVVRGNKRKAETLENYFADHKRKLVGKSVMYQDYHRASKWYGNTDKTSTVLTEDMWEKYFHNNKTKYSSNAYYCFEWKEIDALLGDKWPDLQYYLKDSLGYGQVLPMSFITELHGEDTIVEVDDFLKESKWSYSQGDSVEINKKTGVQVVTIVGYTAKGFKVMAVDGSTTTGFKPSKFIKKVAKPKRKLEITMIPEGIRENFQDVLDKNNLQVHDIFTGTVQRERWKGYGENREEYLEDEDVEMIKCPNCGVKNEIDDSCINCKQSWREILRSEDKTKVLLNVAPEAKPNDVCISEAKCCDNCKHFTFGYGRQGKRQNGYCNFTRLCVRAYNTCDRWFPVDDSTYNSHMKGAMTNLGYGVGNYKDKDLSEFDYTRDMHENNKNKAQKMKADYKVGYDNFLEMLKKEFNL